MGSTTNAIASGQLGGNAVANNYLTRMQVRSFNAQMKACKGEERSCQTTVVDSFRKLNDEQSRSLDNINPYGLWMNYKSKIEKASDFQNFPDLFGMNDETAKQLVNVWNGADLEKIDKATPDSIKANVYLNHPELLVPIMPIVGETEAGVFRFGQGLQSLGKQLTNGISNFFKRTPSSKVSSVSEDVSSGMMKGGNSVANKAVAGKITGYTKHSLNQAVGRNGGKGVNAKHMLDAVKNPKKVVEGANGTMKYQGKKATVILNSEGKVITTYGKSRGSQIWPQGTTRASGSGSAQRRANEAGFSYNPNAIR